MMRLQHATLVTAGILAALTQPLTAQMAPTVLNTVRSQVGQAQAAQSSPSPAKPAAPAATPAKPATPAKSETPATKLATSAKSETPATKPAPSAKSAASVKPAALTSAAPVTPAPEAAAQAASKQGAAAEPAAGGPKRDPFSPLLGNTAPAGSGTPALPPGKAGLMVGTLRIDGLIHGPNGMIAVVSNPQQRVYFLREGDHIFDGQVLRITMEAVAFQQNGRDAFGNSLDHEVTRRLYPNPGEQR
jgi:hypothetical protein